MRKNFQPCQFSLDCISFFAPPRIRNLFRGATLYRTLNRSLYRTLISFVTLLVLHVAVFARTETKITVGRNPDFVAVNSTTNLIYSSNSSEGTVSVIDGATNTPTATISVGGLPQGIAVNPVVGNLRRCHRALA